MLSNLGLERAIIAGICQYGKDALLDVEDIINIKSFTETSNQALFTCLQHTLNNNNVIDQASLLLSINELGYNSLFNKRKDIEYIGSLFNFPILKDNVRNFAIKLEKIHIARKAIQKHQIAIESLQQVTGNEHINEILQLSENPIFDLVLELQRNKEDGPKLLFENIEELVEYLRQNQCENIGIPTPWKEYNAAIGGGLRNGGVNLISSRPKAGKTTLAKESILHFTEKLKIPTLFLDTEMVAEDQVIRALASTSQVPLNTVESGKFADNHLYNINITNAVDKLKFNTFFWYESICGKPFEEILSIIRRWIMQHVGYDENGNTNKCVIVYDYFKLMDRNSLENLQEYQAMGFQISKLTDFCKEFDFPCLAFVQLNRQNDISQSDRLRWLCHSYSTFQKKEPTEIADDGPQAGNRKLKVIDVRFGPGIDDNDYICMNFQRNINKITEIGLRSKLGENDEIIENEFEEQTPNIEENTAPWE